MYSLYLPRLLLVTFLANHLVPHSPFRLMQVIFYYYFLVQSFQFYYFFHLYLVVRLVTLHLEYFSLIYLKYKEPDVHRPFRYLQRFISLYITLLLISVSTSTLILFIIFPFFILYSIPGGVWGSVAIMLPTVVISLFALINSDLSSLISGAVALSMFFSLLSNQYTSFLFVDFKLIFSLVLIVMSYGIKLAWVWATHKWDCCLYRREPNTRSQTRVTTQ